MRYIVVNLVLWCRVSRKVKHNFQPYTRGYPEVCGQIEYLLYLLSYINKKVTS